MDRALGFVSALNPSLLAPPVCALAVSAPVFFAVCRITARRTFAPLVRGSLERACVLAASGIAAVSITVQLGMFAAAVSRSDDTFEAVAWRGFFLFGPPCIAAAAWVAGEMLSGPSPRSEPAFAAGMIAAYAGGVAGFATSINLISTLAGAALSCAGAAATLAAVAAYLAVRGVAPVR
jgi:hypothetical protein